MNVQGKHQRMSLIHKARKKARKKERKKGRKKKERKKELTCLKAQSALNTKLRVLPFTLEYMFTKIKTNFTSNFVTHI